MFFILKLFDLHYSYFPSNFLSLRMTISNYLACIIQEIALDDHSLSTYLVAPDHLSGQTAI